MFMISQPVMSSQCALNHKSGQNCAQGEYLTILAAIGVVFGKCTLDWWYGQVSLRCCTCIMVEKLIIAFAEVSTL